MYLCVKQQLKGLSKDEYLILKELCHTAKNLYNEALYNVRQHYFNEGTYLCYEQNYPLCKDSPNYKTLNSNMAQQILKEVDGTFQSFFGLLEKANAGGYDKRSVRLPGYLEKDGHTTLIIGFVRINGNTLILPYSNAYSKNHPKIKINIPPALCGKKIKEIRIKPMYNARFFEAQYIYQVSELQRETASQEALAIDLGLENLATCVTSGGQSFIIDGRRLKSINQGYNKYNAKYQGIKDKQGQKGITKRQGILAKNRNNAVNDYISKVCRYIINYCLILKIGHIVIGSSPGIQNRVNLADF